MEINPNHKNGTKAITKSQIQSSMLLLVPDELFLQIIGNIIDDCHHFMDAVHALLNFKGTCRKFRNLITEKPKPIVNEKISEIAANSFAHLTKYSRDSLKLFIKDEPNKFSIWTMLGRYYLKHKEIINGDTNTRPIFLAIDNDNLELTKSLLKYPSFDPNVLTEFKFSPLISAIEKNRTQIAKKLLKLKNINVNIQTHKKDRCTALMMAVIMQNVEIVTILIKNPTTKLNLKDVSGQTAYDMAKKLSNSEIKELLQSREESKNANKPNCNIS